MLGPNLKWDPAQPAQSLTSQVLPFSWACCHFIGNRSISDAHAFPVHQLGTSRKVQRETGDMRGLADDNYCARMLVTIEYKGLIIDNLGLKLSVVSISSPFS